MSNCTLAHIDVDAFMGLSSLMEIDLSFNEIEEISPGTFQPMKKIRKIFLHHNKLLRVEHKTFKNLHYLTHLELNDNKIYFVCDQCFSYTNLKTINLSNNRLTQLEKTQFDIPYALSSLKLEGNMWNCSCKLIEFRNFVIERNLAIETKVGINSFKILNLIFKAITLQCYYPDSLRNKLWTELGQEEFACRPQMLNSTAIVYASKENEILVCNVTGSLPIRIEWKFDGHLVEDSDQYRISTSELTVLTEYGKNVSHVVSNLTIVRVRSHDLGTYVCRASNRAGINELAIHLDDPYNFTNLETSLLSSINIIFIIAAVFVLSIFVFGIAILVRRVNKLNKKLSSVDALMKSQRNEATSTGNTQTNCLLNRNLVNMEMQDLMMTNEINNAEPYFNNYSPLSYGK